MLLWKSWPRTILLVEKMKITLVVGSRTSETDFLRTTATGRSLAFNKPPFLDLRLFPNNKEGLSKIYNQAIRECISNPSTLVFAHDDLHFLDYFWFNRILEGLAHFKIVGLAGNLRRVPRQPSWAFVDTRFIWDKREYLSGVVGHGNSFPPRKLSKFGLPRQRVMLLDGLLLGCESETLINNNLFFDERFDFHFYDLDFCRQAESKNISCGTWDLSLIHESRANFASESWKSSYQKYLDKWGD